MGYGHKYYTDAERLKAVKGCMNTNIPVTEYAKQIGVNPRTLRDWMRAFKSFDGGFINITEEANNPSVLVTDYGMEMKILEPEEVKKKSRNFARFDRGIVVIEILDNIHSLIFNTNAAKGSYLESAINYVKKIWDDLLIFLEDGHIELTNNTAERTVKPFVIQRKVFQTSGSYDGAKCTAILFSIIRTAIINCLNVEAYLNYVLSNINTLPIDYLLPYSKEVSKFKIKV